MAKKKSASTTKTRKSKRKSWWAIFFVAVILVVGIVVAFNFSKKSQTASDTSETVNRIAVASSSVKDITLRRGSCPIPTTNNPGTYVSAQFTCNDGKQSAFFEDQCGSVSNLVSYAEKWCLGSNNSTPGKTTPAPTSKPTSVPGNSGGTKLPTPTPTQKIPVGTSCTGTSPDGKSLACLRSTCGSKGFASYSAGDSYCQQAGYSNCCKY